MLHRPLPPASHALRPPPTTHRAAPVPALELKKTASPVRVVTKEDKSKLTELWGTPPLIIVRNKESKDTLQRGPMLGEGGFARVYLATERDGTQKAVKVIAKEQLKSTKTKTKLFGEIKIHQAMLHPNIIKFDECYEDDGNVYMELKLCANGSMLDLLRRRRRYCEPEARFYLVQLIGACEYMHSNSVIHRDLKLGNLMLDAGMNLQVGDFGLAALVKFPGERKKTICGTPNYIAPEILFDTTNGHSFEVDIWSIGVILYTLLVGKPPFQTKDVKNIYKKIKENNYEFPTNCIISTEAVDLISQILTTQPDKRPTLVDILNHKFFVCGPFPPCIVSSATDADVDYSQISIRASHRNFCAVKLQCGISEPVAVRVPLGVVAEEVETVDVKMEDVGEAVVQKQTRGIEREVREVLQPGSPISELLRSARKPLMVSPNAEPRTLLQRKLLAEARAVAASSNPSPRVAAASSAAVPSLWMSNLAISTKENSGAGLENDGRSKGRSKVVDVEMHVAGSTPVRKAGSSVAERLIMGTRKEDVAVPVEPTLTRYPARELYDRTWRALDAALNLSTSAALQALPNPLPLDMPRVFITSWVDYTHKYGTAYALSDGSAGVYFNDSTTMVLSADDAHFDYISNRKGNIYSRRHYEMTGNDPKDVKGNYPQELERKAYLLKYFEQYMARTLKRELSWTWRDTERQQNMDFLVKYYRMKQAILFKMSNEVLQFNFYDHTKIILHENGSIVTYIDADFTLKTFSLYSLFNDATRMGYYRATPKVPSTDPSEVKRAKRLEPLKFVISKLEYCRDVLKALTNRQSSSVTESTSTL